MPTLYHPDLPREQTIEVANYRDVHRAAGWLPVEKPAPKQPAEPVKTEQAPAPLATKKEN